MLKVGGGNRYNRAHSECDILRPPPFSIILLLGHCWQEFLGCASLETSGKSTRTDFMALVVGALPPFPGPMQLVARPPPPPPPVPTRMPMQY